MWNGRLQLVWANPGKLIIIKKQSRSNAQTVNVQFFVH